MSWPRPWCCRRQLRCRHWCDERWGWRTAANRRHPIGRETGQAPEEGIRYLSGDRRPAPQEIVAAVYDGRTGTSRPTA